MKYNALMNRKPTNAFNYLYFIIPLFLVIVILYVPFFQSIYYSFTNWNGFSEPTFVGFKNYIFLSENTHFINALKNNALISLSAPFFIIIPLILALLLFNNKSPLLKSARMMLMLPYAISMTIVGIIFKALLQFDGPLNVILEKIGLGFLAIEWLGRPGTALFAIIMTAFWKEFGLSTIIYLTALSNINQDILDAGRVDGVNRFQEFIHIILPQLNPILVFLVTMTLIADFKTMFDYVFNMTAGGPGFATETMEFLLYNEAFKYSNMGFACTIGLVVFAIVIIITYFLIKFLTRRD